LPRPERSIRPIQPIQPIQLEKKSLLRDCAVWPPKTFPTISDIYALKLEYDCRNRAIAHQRHDLASQEARQSTALAEKQDRGGIDDKNRWAEKEQRDIESRQLELDKWRDAVFQKLQLVGQNRSADVLAPSPSDSTPLRVTD
jgi:hypothetical protein